MDLHPHHRFDPSRPDSFRVVNPDYLHRQQDTKRQEELEQETCTYVLNVDSVQRDKTIFPDSNRFKVYLRSPLCNVLSCRLLSAEVPNVAYTIDSRNQRFAFEEVVNGIAHRVEFVIPDGHYDGTTLCEEIQRLMNIFSNADLSLPEAPYDVSLQVDRNKAIFSSDVSITRFRIMFEENTCHGVLGFDPGPTPWNTDPVEPGTGVDPRDPVYAGGIVSRHYVDVAGDVYVYLCSPELNSTFHEVVYSKNILGSDALFSKAPSHAFAKVSLLGPPGSVVFYNHKANHDACKRFVPPASKVSVLEFEWIRGDGTRVDFKNLENSFTLAFTCVSRSLGMPQFANSMSA